MAILRTEKAMMSAMCGVKIEKRNQELEFAKFKEYFEWTSQGEWSTMAWCFVLFLRRDNGDVLGRALDFKVAERRGRGRPKMTWRRILIRLD